MDLSVNFLGYDLETPLLLGSGQHTMAGSQIEKWIEKLARNYWSGIITKTYLRGSNMKIFPHLWTTKKFQNFAMQNAGPDFSVDHEEELELLARGVRKAHDHNIIVIGSVMGLTQEDWESISKRIESTGVDALELNLSCPAKTKIFEEQGSLAGYLVGQNPVLAAEVVKMVRKVTKIPIIAKLTPEVSNIVPIARACLDAGASALTAINTIQGIIGINIDNGIPYCSDLNNKAIKSGLSGPIIRPIGLRHVSEICSQIDNVVVSGVGGISSAENVLEYIMVGSTTVQLCTAVMWNGFGIGSTIRNNLAKFMNERSIGKLDEIRGISLKYFKDDFSDPASVTAKLDDKRCKYCKKCFISCEEAAYSAISLNDIERTVTISEKKCQGCGLCLNVCPEEAIKLIDYRD